MLENKLKDNRFYPMLSKLADGLGLYVLGISSQKKGSSEVHVTVTVLNKTQITSVSDCEKFHKASYPYLEAEVGRDLLSMEVETPGIHRNIKDVYEFKLLTNHKVRVYTDMFSSWVSGIIKNSNDSEIVLSSYTVEDTSLTGDEVIIPYEKIHKAKIL